MQASVVFALVLTLVLTSGWVLVNASADASVRRYESILQYDKSNPGYAYESLARHYQERGFLQPRGSGAD